MTDSKAMEAAARAAYGDMHWTEEAKGNVETIITTYLAQREADGAIFLDADVAQFLMGAGPLEGVWFHDSHPTRKGAFWWRTVIRERLAALRARGA